LPPELTPEIIAQRIAKSLADMPIIQAFTIGEEPKRRRKRQKMPKKITGGPVAACKRRRKGKKGDRRCNSLFYADCLKINGATKKTKKCERVMRTKLSR
jgi:hypothetical protein